MDTVVADTLDKAVFCRKMDKMEVKLLLGHLIFNLRIWWLCVRPTPGAPCFFFDAETVKLGVSETSRTDCLVGIRRQERLASGEQYMQAFLKKVLHLLPAGSEVVLLSDADYVRYNRNDGLGRE